MHSFMVFGFMVNKKSLMLSSLLTQTHFGAEVSMYGKALESTQTAQKGE